SMVGERLAHAQVTRVGIVGDRQWAVRNDAIGEIQGGKKFPELMRCTARFRRDPREGEAPPPVDIEFPDGGFCGSDAPGALSQRLLDVTGGTPCSLWPVQPPEAASFYRRRPRTKAEAAVERAHNLQREDGEPYPDLSGFPASIFEFTSIPGMFFDLSPLHLLTTASLMHMRRCNPDADWDVRRFRPNLLVETADTTAEGLLEFAWLGRTLRVGGLTMRCEYPTPRCGMITRPQPGLGLDKGVLRTVVREADQNLGVYADVVEPGDIKVGDEIVLI
ncbi:MAG: MOSC domain-containing protein, partial [Panacagrimonas sp.]